MGDRCHRARPSCPLGARSRGGGTRRRRRSDGLASRRWGRLERDAVLSEHGLERVVLVLHRQIRNGRDDLPVQRFKLDALLDELLSTVDVLLEGAVRLDEHDIDEDEHDHERGPRGHPCYPAVQPSHRSPFRDADQDSRTMRHHTTPPGDSQEAPTGRHDRRRRRHPARATPPSPDRRRRRVPGSATVAPGCRIVPETPSVMSGSAPRKSGLWPKSSSKVSMPLNGPRAIEVSKSMKTSKKLPGPRFVMLWLGSRCSEKLPSALVSEASSKSPGSNPGMSLVSRRSASRIPLF